MSSDSLSLYVGVPLFETESSHLGLQHALMMFVNDSRCYLDGLDASRSRDLHSARDRELVPMTAELFVSVWLIEYFSVFSSLYMPPYITAPQPSLQRSPLFSPLSLSLEHENLSLCS